MVCLQFVDVPKFKPHFTSEDNGANQETCSHVLITGKLIDFAFEALQVQYVVVIKNFSTQQVKQ